MSLLSSLLAAGLALHIPADAGRAEPVVRPDSLIAAACQPLALAATRAPEPAADVQTTLALHNGAVRWDVTLGPIRLWIQPRPAADVDPDHPGGEWHRAVLEAAASWRDVVPGLAFRVVRDSAEAEVIVTWERALHAVRALRGSDDVSALAWRTAGQTTLTPADDGRAIAAQVRLSVAAPSGPRYGVEDTRAVARHELGHVLGLAHHAAANSVMAPLVRVDRLTIGDRAALRLLYALPIGARCTLPAAVAAR